jgi:chromosome segregation ATPase
MNNNEKTNERKKIVSFLLLPMLFGSLFFNILFLINRHKLISRQERALLVADSSISVKLLVEKQLNEVQETLNGSQLKNDELYTTVSKLNTELKENRRTIEKITKENQTVIPLKKQLKDVKSHVDDYEKQTNSILKEKNELEGKITELNKTIIDIKKDNEELKKKLEIVKDLKGYEISVLNYKVKTTKKRPTMKAKKVNRISVTFTLAENIAAESGKKNLYIVIYDPMKNVLTSKQEKFINKKTNLEQAYSSLKIIDYKNEEQKIIIDYDAETKLTKGKYKVEVYADGSLSGKKEFELR